MEIQNGISFCVLLIGLSGKVLNINGGGKYIYNNNNSKKMDELTTKYFTKLILFINKIK